MNISTPETDAAVVEASQYYQPLYPSANGRNQPVHADFARNIERDRDVWKAKAKSIYCHNCGGLIVKE